jgi:hypothetical protein
MVIGLTMCPWLRNQTKRIATMRHWLIDFPCHSTTQTTQREIINDNTKANASTRFGGGIVILMS